MYQVRRRGVNINQQCRNFGEGNALDEIRANLREKRGFEVNLRGEYDEESEEVLAPVTKKNLIKIIVSVAVVLCVCD